MKTYQEHLLECVEKHTGLLLRVNKLKTSGFIDYEKNNYCISCNRKEDKSVNNCKTCNRILRNNARGSIKKNVVRY